MKHPFITILLFLILTNFSVYSQETQSLELQEGLTLLQSENFEAAFEKFSKILVSEPENQQARETFGAFAE